MSTLHFSPSAWKNISIAALSSLALWLAWGLAPAYALDPSQMPGYQCYAQDSSGQCTSYSYFDYGTSGYTYPYSSPYSSYPAYSYPSYTYPYTYTNATAGVYAQTCNGLYSNCVNGVSVRGTGSPNPVLIGNTVTYSIYVRNDTYQPRTVNVQAFLDPNTSFVSASRTPTNNPNGYGSLYNNYTNGNYYNYGNNYYGGSEVDWLMPLSANSGVRFTFRVMVQNSARDGQSLQLRLQAEGSTDYVATMVRNQYYTYNNYNNYYPSNYYNCPSGNTYNCYNPYGYGNQYNNYYAGYCDPRYGNCGITIQLSDSVDPVSIGQLETYSIYLRNNDSVLRTVNVQGYLDSGIDFYSASDGGSIYSAGSVQWNSISIGPNSSRTLTVSGRVNGLRGNGSLTFTAQTNTGLQQTQMTSVRF